MSNYTKLYWLTRLDYLQGFFIAIAVVSGIIFILHFIIKAADDEDWKDSYSLLKGWQKSSVLTMCIVFVLLSCLTPNKNETILIMAGGKTLDYVQSDTSLSKIPYQTTSIISQYLEKSLKEMKEAK